MDAVGRKHGIYLSIYSPPVFLSPPNPSATQPKYQHAISHMHMHIHDHRLQTTAQLQQFWVLDADASSAFSRSKQVPRRPPQLHPEEV